MTRPGITGERTFAGLIWALGGVAFASLLLTVPKIIGPDVSPLQVVFFRYLMGLITITPFFLRRLSIRRRQSDESPRVAVSTTRLHVLRAFVAMLRISAFVYAVTHMPFANAQAVSLTNGVFMILFAVTLLRERINATTIVAALICFAGAVIAAEPSADATLFFSTGALAALFGAALWGLESVIIRYTVVRDSTERILFIVNAAACIMMLVPALLVWRPLDWTSLGLLMMMGPLAIATQFSNLSAFRAARANVLAPIRYMAVVFALLIGWLLFGEWPSVIALAGMALVAGGGAAVTIIAASPGLRARALRP